MGMCKSQDFDGYLLGFMIMLSSYLLIVNCIIISFCTLTIKMVKNIIIVCNLPTIIILDIQFEKLTIFTTHICHTNHINVCQNQNYICPQLTNESTGLSHVTLSWPMAAHKTGHVTCGCSAAVMSADKLNIKL